MRNAGTKNVEQATRDSLLADICRDYQAHGFHNIILIGDSGGNLPGIKRVAKNLTPFAKIRSPASTISPNITMRIHGLTHS